MELHTLTWGQRQGWSKQLPELAAERALVLAFGGRQQTAQAAITEIAARYPGASICGCSGAGEIFAGAVSDDRVAVAALQFERGHHRAVWSAIERAAESEQVGRRLGEQLRGPDLRGILVLSDGLNVNGSALVNGLRASVDANVIITGGLAGDGPRFFTHLGRARCGGCEPPGVRYWIVRQRAAPGLRVPRRLGCVWSGTRGHQEPW